MKKLIIGLMFVMACSVARAELDLGSALNKIPALKQGVAFSVVDSGFNYLATFDVAQFKGFNLEAGYAGRQENTQDKAVVVLSYSLFNAKEAGVKLPILDLIDLRPGVYYGLGRIEKPSDSKLGFEQDYGVSCTALSLKF